ncbi:ribonuclease I [Acetobacter persici]|uniref:ribonuclease T2 family protein n=1 Tax=Acetobacter persici TaxID=1076596 RepID=UPI001BABAA86|nr:ribonuclease I [Acetobacter persici]MBS1001413.1 ribonuclease I [Acetobacter persici]
MRAVQYVFTGMMAASFLLSGCAHQPSAPSSSSPSTSSAGATEALALAAPRHGDFGHYTLALTWQPGFCTGPEGNSCQADQPHTPLIGLHGLWASRPSDLIQAQVPVTTWWRKGCSLYDGGAPSAAPALSDALTHRLSEVVAHTHSSLVAHEYTKHVQCFGMDGEQFFSVATHLRDRFAALPAAAHLLTEAGTRIAKADLTRQIEADTGPLPNRGVQFQCNKTPTGEAVLSQIWFTLKPASLDKFPKTDAFLSSPQLQDNCPAQFLVPQWATAGTVGGAAR